MPIVGIESHKSHKPRAAMSYCSSPWPSKIAFLLKRRGRGFCFTAQWPVYPTGPRRNAVCSVFGLKGRCEESHRKKPRKKPCFGLRSVSTSSSAGGATASAFGTGGASLAAGLTGGAGSGSQRLGRMDSTVRVTVSGSCRMALLTLFWSCGWVAQ